MKIRYFILPLLLIISKSESFKIRGGKTRLETPCISIRVQNQPINLNKTTSGENYLNANLNDQLRIIVSETCEKDITCVILKQGQHSSTLSSASVPLRSGHDFVSCKRSSKDYLKFHLFVRDQNKFFNQATIVDRNEDNFTLRCLGGFYTNGVTLRGNEERIDVPYDPLNGFLVDKKLYSNQTFYQCVFGDEKVSFLYYNNLNTLNSNVAYKMQLQSFTIKLEIQCIIDGTLPTNQNIKAILACRSDLKCPKLEPRVRLGNKTIFAASIPNTSTFNTNHYTCVFVRNGKVEALAYIIKEEFSIQLLANIIIGVGAFLALSVIALNKYGGWRYTKLHGDGLHNFKTSELLLDDSEDFGSGNSSVIRLVTFTRTNKKVVVKYSRQRWQFEKELKMLNELNHSNIIKAYGSVTLQKEKQCINSSIRHLVLPYYQKTCLEKFIRQFYPPRKIENEFHSTDDTMTITLSNLISFGWQISKALAYLKQQGITHRDVAMRNVLVSDDLICKLTDFERAERGETRDVSFATHILKFFTIDKSDVPTMYPAECKKGAYFYESEVYCFGLLLLEMFNFSKPFEQNHRWPPTQPQHCPSLIYTIITDCLITDRKKRPSINSCENKLSTISEMFGAMKHADLMEKLDHEFHRDFLRELLTPNYSPATVVANIFI